MQSSLLASSAVYIIDALVVIVVLIFAVKGAKKGFVDCLFGIISTLGAIVIALLFTKAFLGLTGGLFGLQGNRFQTHKKRAKNEKNLCNRFGICLCCNGNLLLEQQGYSNRG